MREEKNIWIVVPTYWGNRGSRENPPLVQFDHPSDPSTAGTIERTLDSFGHLKGNFKLLIVCAATHHEIAKQVDKHVRQLIEPYRHQFPLYYLSPENLNQLNGKLCHPLLTLESYGSIRNVELMLPFLGGGDVVIGIDDDEIIEIDDFIEKASLVGRHHSSEVVHGLSGPYFSQSGSYRINNADNLKGEPNLLLKKNYFMDQAVCQAMESGEEVVRSNVGFGGNMVFSREVIEGVCHDPYVPRGEDYDYIINGLALGYKFFFRRDMPIVHLPPDSTGSQAGENVFKLNADIHRFVYLNEKYDYFKKTPPFDLNLDDISPYPGTYIEQRAEFEKGAVEAVQKLYPKEVEGVDRETLLADSQKVARKKVVEYAEYLKKWRECTGKIVSQGGGSLSNVEEFRLT